MSAHHRVEPPEGHHHCTIGGFAPRISVAQSPYGKLPGLDPAQHKCPETTEPEALETAFTRGRADRTEIQFTIIARTRPKNGVSGASHAVIDPDLAMAALFPLGPHPRLPQEQPKHRQHRIREALSGRRSCSASFNKRNHLFVQQLAPPREPLLHRVSLSSSSAATRSIDSLRDRTGSAARGKYRESVPVLATGSLPLPG